MKRVGCCVFFLICGEWAVYFGGGTGGGVGDGEDIQDTKIGHIDFIPCLLLTTVSFCLALKT